MYNRMGMKSKRQREATILIFNPHFIEPALLGILKVGSLVHAAGHQVPTLPGTCECTTVNGLTASKSINGLPWTGPCDDVKSIWPRGGIVRSF